jgi:hypothetical protein
MRSGQVIGGALLVLALGAADDAEARGRGGRVGSRGGLVLASTGSAAAGVASARDGSDQATREPGLRPVMPVTAPAPLQREVRAAEPWCANRRVVGSGTGFCVIN